MSTMTINGEQKPLPDDADALLADVIRDRLNLTGTKLVCGSGVCGGCTVLLDGVPVASCLLPAKAASGKAVTTVEGIGGDRLHPIQKAFMANDALQCGFCTPGFIVEAVAFHDRWRADRGTAMPSREEIAAAFSGHLCRCGAYDNIFRAIEEACAGRFDGDHVTSPRLEARDKVTGKARYTVDIRHDGQLEGMILRAELPHARITALDLAPARSLPGVAAAISLLAEDKTVRYVGAPIAAVAAKDRRTALAALAAIGVTSETLPAVVGLDAARRADAPVVFEKKDRKYAGNVSEGSNAPAPWKGNLRGRPGRSRRSQDAPDHGSPRHARSAIRFWSKTLSAWRRSRMPASSRMPPSRDSTATNSPSTSRRRPCTISWGRSASASGLRTTRCA